MKRMPFFNIPPRFRLSSEPLHVSRKSRVRRHSGNRSDSENPKPLQTNNNSKPFIKKPLRTKSLREDSKHAYSDAEVFKRKLSYNQSRWPKFNLTSKTDNDNVYKRQASKIDTVLDEKSSDTRLNKTNSRKVNFTHQIYQDMNVKENEQTVQTDVKIKTTKINPKPDSSNLLQLDLYIQENSDMMLILLLEKGSCKEETIKKLCQWKTTLSQLGELDLFFSMSEDSYNEKIQRPFSLKFDRLRKNLTGNVLWPVTAAENEFCAAVIQMHEDFNTNKSLHDVSLKSHSSHIYGHKTMSLEVYYQSINSHRNTITTSSTY